MSGLGSSTDEDSEDTEIRKGKEGPCGEVGDWYIRTSQEGWGYRVTRDPVQGKVIVIRCETEVVDLSVHPSTIHHFTRPGLWTPGPSCKAEL